MKRLNPGTIAGFFKAHPDILPIQNTFTERRENGTISGCCGLAAAILAAPPDQETGESMEKGELDDLWTSTIGNMIGLPGDYSVGFANGWDGDKDDGPGDDLYLQGIRDGNTAYSLATQPS